MLRKLLTAAAVSALALPATAGARTLTTIETPSVNVDPSKVRFNGSEHPRRLRANVLLPDGYDGKRRFPVLYLLHGAGDAYDSWADPELGNVLKTAKDLQAIIVMPEGDTGFYTNWWNGGRRGDPGWERFYLEELIPLVERRYRVRPGRRWHAAAGLSMGGFGATYLASQLPGYFGSAATFSGFVSHQRPQAVEGLRLVAGVAYEEIFGPVDGFYATGHNPPRLVDNLLSTRLYVTVGNGVSDQDTDPGAVTAGGVAEAELDEQARELVRAARAAGVDTTHVPLNGVHSWPYWRRHLRDAIAWGLFRPVPEAPSFWTYRTVTQRGEAWALAYSFAAAPSEVVTLERTGRRLLGFGLRHDHRAQRRAVRVHRPAAVRPPVPAAHLRPPGGDREAAARAPGPHHEGAGAGHAQGGGGAPPGEPGSGVHRATPSSADEPPWPGEPPLSAPGQARRAPPAGPRDGPAPDRQAPAGGPGQGASLSS